MKQVGFFLSEKLHKERFYRSYSNWVFGDTLRRRQPMDDPAFPDNAKLAQPQLIGASVEARNAQKWESLKVAEGGFDR